MDDSTIRDLFGLLDLFVMELSEDNTYRLIGSVPDWFEHLFPGAAVHEKKLAPEEWSPFLENFLFDATEFWKETGNGRTPSGPWIESDSSGTEFPLEAYAISLGNRKILTIDHPKIAYSEQQSILQKGRENVLNKELLEEEVRNRTAQIRNREEEVALRLVTAADFRDDETGAHIRRIGLYSEVLTKKLGWSAGEIDNIRIAAPMHDIGKIGIPDSVLLKPDLLTDEEYIIMKNHTVIGGKMLENSRADMINMAHEIALYHLEKLDGTGYPSGLAGAKIPMSARIVAVVDVYDALVHKRVYKAPMSEITTLDIMKKSSGQHFDPALIDLFFDSLDDFRRIASYEDPGMFPTQ